MRSPVPLDISKIYLISWSDVKASKMGNRSSAGQMGQTAIESMIKYTKHNLTRLEDIFTELKINVRYEKGNFQSGYCIVFGKNIVIVNKFFDIEARMNTLLEILDQGTFNPNTLSAENLEWYNKVRKGMLKSV